MRAPDTLLTIVRPELSGIRPPSWASEHLQSSSILLLDRDTRPQWSPHPMRADSLQEARAGTAPISAPSGHSGRGHKAGSAHRPRVRGQDRSDDKGLSFHQGWLPGAFSLSQAVPPSGSRARGLSPGAWPLSLESVSMSVRRTLVCSLADIREDRVK